MPKTGRIRKCSDKEIIEMKQNKNDRKIIYISLIFIVLAAMYFMPASEPPV